MKEQVIEWKNQAIALVEFIFEDLKSIDLRAKMVFAEIVGFPVQSPTSPKAYAELEGFNSMEAIGESCLHQNSKTARLCSGMTARYGADWYSVSAERQVGFAREGLKRAYLKYGRSRNQ